ncbi:MAG: nitroreductase/quinone reductase family protein [Candidatus Binatia bacterium]|nr:nitroreductase/quinone reductase family protein [Candidatus Binatia bacterium]
MATKKKSSVELTHFGRKSGKPFKLTVWFVDLDGDVWIGTRDTARNWVRNVQATGRAELDFGDGAVAYRGTVGTDAELERFNRAILSAHPVGARIINFMARGKPPCCFRLVPEG